MTPERWQQIKGVLQSGLDLAPSERAAFLDRACEGDEPLRHESNTAALSGTPGPEPWRISESLAPVPRRREPCGERTPMLPASGARRLHRFPNCLEGRRSRSPTSEASASGVREAAVIRILTCDSHALRSNQEVNDSSHSYSGSLLFEMILQGSQYRRTHPCPDSAAAFTESR
jgi:hypothetical protein